MNLKFLSLLILSLVLFACKKETEEPAKSPATAVEPSPITNWERVFEIQNSSANQEYVLNNTTAFIAFATSTTVKLAKTTDAGITWVLLDSKLLGTQIFDLMFYNASIGFLVIQGGGTHSTEDGGVTWTKMEETGTFFSNGKNLLLLSKEIHESKDLGKTFAKIGDQPDEYFDLRFRRRKFFVDGTGFLGYQNGITISNDGGESWKKINAPFSAITKYLPISKQEIYVNSDGVLFYTSDGGTTWTETNSNLQWFTLAYKSDTLFTSFNGGSIYWSVNNGKDITFDNEEKLAAHAFLIGNTLVAYNDEAIFKRKF